MPWPTATRRATVEGSGTACVSLGRVFENPGRNFSIDTQYAAARLMVRQLVWLGYERPGLVINPYVDLITDSRFQVGFLSPNSFALRGPRVPLLMSKPTEEEEIAMWFRTFRPDVVVSSFPLVLHWFDAMGVRVPREVGFATFDADPMQLPQVSGIDQQHEEMAAAAVELLVQMINLNQFAPPRFARGFGDRGNLGGRRDVGKSELPVPTKGRPEASHAAPCRFDLTSRVWCCVIRPECAASFPSLFWWSLSPWPWFWACPCRP